MLLAIIGIAVSTSTTNLFGGKKQRLAATEPKPIEIAPGLGRTILPTYRVVALFGAPNGGAVLGDLGVGTPTEAADRLVNQIALPYKGGKPVLPALELISVIAHRTPQASGTYSTRYTDDQIQPYLEAARQHNGILILDIQPGRSPWMDEVRGLTRWLKEPDVSLALDPEWSVNDGEVPGVGVIGKIDAAEINEVSAYLQQIITENKLPQKLLVVHEFKDNQLTDQSQIVDRKDVQVVLSVDGFGPANLKRDAYRTLTSPGRGKSFPMAFKLFFQEDNDPKVGSEIMSPYDVMELTPQPDMVIYE